jgi:hypothetical protein
MVEKSLGDKGFNVNDYSQTTLGELLSKEKERLFQL